MAVRGRARRDGRGRRRGRPARPHGRAWLHLAVTALLLQVGQFSFVYAGLSHGVPAGLSSLILGMAPLLVGLLTPLVLATRLGVAPVIGLVIGACGVYIVLSDGLGGGLGAQVVFPVLGMLALTAGTLYQKRYNDDTPVTTSVVVQMLTSLVVTVAACRSSASAGCRSTWAAGPRWSGSGCSTRQARSR